MKRAALKTLMYALPALLGAGALTAQPGANNPHWVLEWADEFNGSSVNRNFWKVIHHRDDSEDQGFTAENLEHSHQTVHVDRPENITVSNGNLVINLLREENPYSCVETDYWHCWREHVRNEGYLFTSGRLDTRMQNFRYGYIEARIRVPVAAKAWPAFWTLGHGFENNFYNSCEIDIFEMNADLGDQVMPTNLHAGYCSLDSIQQCNSTHYECVQYPCHGENTVCFNWGNVWRTYGLEWSPEVIRWYMDGQVVRTVQNALPDSTDGFHDASRIIFEIRMYEHAEVAYNYFQSHFPATMEMDYVRYYVPNFDCDSNIIACQYDLGNHDNKVKGAIELGGQGCYNDITPGNSVELLASQGITIEGDFWVPVEAELYVDVMSCYEPSEVKLATASTLIDIEPLPGDSLIIKLMNGQQYAIRPEDQAGVVNLSLGHDVWVYPANAIDSVYQYQIATEFGIWEHSNSLAVPY